MRNSKPEAAETALPTEAVADVIIVLGAAQLADGTPGPAIERRVGHAVGCWRRGMTPHLLMTGGPTAIAKPEAETMAEVARALGVPADAVHLEPLATRTLENAAFSGRVMAERGWTRAVLVTDRPHMPRALDTFRAFGIETHPEPVALAPSAESARLLLWELVARVVYPWRVRRYLERDL